jgi:hypothetical protein
MTTIHFGSDCCVKGNPAAFLFNSQTIQGLVFRRDCMNFPRDEDAEFAQCLVHEIAGLQSDDGSWDGSIVETSGNVGKLLDLGCPCSLNALQRAKDWIVRQQNLDDPTYAGLFLENGYGGNDTRKGGRFHRNHAEFSPLVRLDASCGITNVISTSLALEALLRLGEDAETSEAVSLAVDRLIHLSPNGLPCGYKVRNSSIRDGKGYRSQRLWQRPNVFGPDPDSDKSRNPGMMICANFFWRSLSFSMRLADSPYVDSILLDWSSHQGADGTFETKSYLFDFYFAVDTLSHFYGKAIARQMFMSLLPLIVRRQKRDGLWYRNGEWLFLTYSIMRALHRFRVIELRAE